MSEELDFQLGNDRPDMMKMGMDPIQQELMALRRHAIVENGLGWNIRADEFTLLQDLDTVRSQ